MTSDSVALLTITYSSTSMPVLSVTMVTDLLRAAVTLLPNVHQSVATVGGAVSFIGMGDIEETRSSCQQDHLLKVICTAAAEVLRFSAGTGRDTRHVTPHLVTSIKHPTFTATMSTGLCVCVCVSYVVPEFMMHAAVGQVQDRPSSWFIPRL